MRTAQSGHSDTKSRALHIMMVMYVVKIMQMDCRIWFHFCFIPSCATSLQASSFLIRLFRTFGELSGNTQLATPSLSMTTLQCVLLQYEKNYSNLRKVQRIPLLTTQFYQMFPELSSSDSFDLTVHLPMRNRREYIQRKPYCLTR